MDLSVPGGYTGRMEAKDSLGDRMKANYENRSRHYLTRRTPVIVRADGRAFHSLSGLEKPYDENLRNAMEKAALATVMDMAGCKVAYAQSDEVSFLITDFDTLQTQAWFDYNLAKIVSITAAHMSVGFSSVFGRSCLFDARAFNLPREEVVNYFLWRAKDWERNSVSMYCQAHFSPKQLHGQGRADQHDMLHSIGKNWAMDLDQKWKNGTWIVRREGGFDIQHDTRAEYASIAPLIDPFLLPERLSDTLPACPPSPAAT